MSPEPYPSPAGESGAVREAIARSRPEDYDGHTEFERLTPAERLVWLESAIRFISSSRPEKAEKTGTPAQEG
ncbi:MAG TPA: hypothetical protein VN877_02890 [Opitutaceae bacterium]|nr:hypothetical protein [Opitutaceae bacterium]